MRLFSKIKISLFAAIILGLAACSKKDMNIDPDNKTSDFLELIYIDGGNGTTVGSGLPYFAGAALTYPPSIVSDTVSFSVALGGTASLGNDLPITIGKDDSKLLANFSTDSITYEAMPDSLYKILNTTATIKAGDKSADFRIVFFPSKIDPSRNYSLPITVTDSKGYKISGNFGHIYFHTIGNPLAGLYNWDYVRWNNATMSGTPTTTWTDVNLFAPVNPTTIEVQSGYGDQNGFNCRYVLSFKNNNGVLSDFKVKIHPSDVTNSLNANTISLTIPASILQADPVTKHFKFSFGVVNSAGSPRTFTDEFYQ